MQKTCTGGLMKINRLLEITIILLNKGTVTAKELAERFEVSTRTIYRDIDILSSSGIPLYSSRGSNGGISLLEKYSLNKTLLSDKESESILFALKTLQVTKYPDIDIVLEKLGGLFKNPSTDWIHIDFSPWEANPNECDKFSYIKQAVLECRIIEFDYISADNIKSHRCFEPTQLIFKSHSWYILGWDKERKAYRTFRISRIKNVFISDKFFKQSKRCISEENKQIDFGSEKEIINIELKFTKEALYRLYDEYNEKFITKNNDGTYTVKLKMPESEWVYGYIMSFGYFVEVISPKHIRNIIIDKTKKMFKQYDI